MKTLVQVILLLLISTVSHAEECSTDKAIEAEKNITSLSNWDELHQHYQKYFVCDDGSIAEGYSDVVSRLLSEKWMQLKSIQIDDKFINFIILHIDKSWDYSRFDAVANNAAENCYDKIKDVCDAIIIFTDSL